MKISDPASSPKNGEKTSEGDDETNQPPQSLEFDLRRIVGKACDVDQVDYATKAVRETQN
jgi:hypothetical protein